MRQEKAEGRVKNLSGIIQEIEQAGATSLREIAEGLNARGIETARRGQWSAIQVSRVLARMEGRPGAS